MALLGGLDPLICCAIESNLSWIL